MGLPEMNKWRSPLLPGTGAGEAEVAVEAELTEAAEEGEGEDEEEGSTARRPERLGGGRRAAVSARPRVIAPYDLMLLS